MSFIPHMPCDRCKELESRLDSALSRIEWFIAQLDIEQGAAKEAQDKLQACEKSNDDLADALSSAEMDRDAALSRLHELSKIDEAFQKVVDETDFFADRCKELEQRAIAAESRLGRAVKALEAIRDGIPGPVLHALDTLNGLKRMESDAMLADYERTVETSDPPGVPAHLKMLQLVREGLEIVSREALNMSDATNVDSWMDRAGCAVRGQSFWVKDVEKPCSNPVEDKSGFQLCATCGFLMADHQ